MSHGVKIWLYYILWANDSLATKLSFMVDIILSQSVKWKYSIAMSQSQ